MLIPGDLGLQFHVARVRHGWGDMAAGTGSWLVTFHPHLGSREGTANGMVCKISVAVPVTYFLQQGFTS